MELEQSVQQRHAKSRTLTYSPGDCKIRTCLHVQSPRSAGEVATLSIQNLLRVIDDGRNLTRFLVARSELVSLPLSLVGSVRQEHA